MKLFEHKGLKVLYKSTGGIETSIILPDHNIAFDFGKCSDELVEIPNIFLTHGHLDHSAGLPYYFSQRSLKNHGPGKVYVPENIHEPLTKICKLWQEIEEFDYSIDLFPVKENDRVHLKNGYYVLTGPAFHRIKTYSYILMHKVQKLKPEYLNLSGSKIKKLKEENADIFMDVETPLFAYTGDTTIESIQQSKLLQNAKILFVECTYIDEKRTVERARKWGHIHLDEILENLDYFQNEKIVLMHMSRRYGERYIESVLKNKIPLAWQKRLIYI